MGLSLEAFYVPSTPEIRVRSRTFSRDEIFYVFSLVLLEGKESESELLACSSSSSCTIRRSLLVNDDD